MGPIADRTRDRLGASDLAIVEFRRIMVDAVRRFVADGTVLGDDSPSPETPLCAFEGIIPKTEDWRTLRRVAGANVS
jgi:phthalate 4,5-dioxygenase oxygenase subunit